MDIQPAPERLILQEVEQDGVRAVWLAMSDWPDAIMLSLGFLEAAGEVGCLYVDGATLYITVQNGDAKYQIVMDDSPYVPPHCEVYHKVSSTLDRSKQIQY